jgi:putative thioredoxin
MSQAINQDVVDVSEEDFDSSVLEASRAKPVVVDFWAPWCGPCRVLGPVLEKLAEEHNGAFVLAKVNVDENPALSDRYGIQGIPAVKGFRNGELVAEFVGALPEREVRSFLAKLLPTEADEAIAEGKDLEEEGKLEDAERVYRSALEREPTHGALLLALSKMLATRGEEREALLLLEQVKGGAEEAQANRISVELKLRGGVESGKEEEYRERVETNASDLEARLALARLSASKGDYDKACQQLLEILKRDRKFQDDQPRKTMLEIFEVVGPRSELAEKYRGEMAKVLFS